VILIDVSKTVRHRLQCPIELSRIVNAAEQRRISRGDGRMSQYLQRSVRQVGRRPAQAPDKIVVLLLVLWRQVATSAYDLTSLPVRSSISSSWIDRTEFRNSGQLNISDRNLANSRSIVSSVTCPVGQLGVARHALVSQRESEHRAVERVEPPCPPGSRRHIGEYPLQTRNVCETAAGFVADRTRTACCRDRDRQ
jgi:hypothetical protein